MIDGKKRAHTILDELAQMDADFILTGSRSTGTAKDTSDWDFFTVFHYEVEDKLLAMGFQSILNAEHHYWDLSIVNLMRYKSGNLQIDVQLTHPSYLEAKKKANDLHKILAPQFRGADHRRSWWDMVMTFMQQQSMQSKVAADPFTNAGGLHIAKLMANKIAAIKQVRTYTDCGLKEAKDIVDNFILELERFKTMYKDRPKS